MALTANEHMEDGFVRDADKRLIVVTKDGAVIGGGAGGGGGTEYLEGDTPTTVTGPSLMWKDVGGAMVPVRLATPLPVQVTSMPAGGSGLTDAELRASPVPVEQATSVDVADGGGSLTVDAPVATPVAVRLSDGAAFFDPRDVSDRSGRLLGHVTVDNFPAVQPVSDNGGSITVDGTFWQATQPVSGPLTDAQLRASAVPVSGPLTDAQLRASAVPVSGPLTDVQLRASAVPVDVTDEVAREVGRVGSTIMTPATGGITSANTPVTVAVDGFSGLGLMVSGTYAAFTLLFQQSTDGGTTWINATATQSDANLVEAAVGGLTANQTQIFSVTLLPGATHFRVLGFGAGPATGTCNVRLTGQAITRPNAQAVRIVDNTVNPSRLRIWDGTDEATILPVRTVPATTEKAIPMMELPTRLRTYQAVTAEVAPAITIGVKELFSFWHPSAVTSDAYIVDITVSVLVTTASTTGGRTNVEVFKITSAPTGGTNVAAADVGGGLGTSDIITNSAANVMQVKTGGGALGTALIRQGIEHATQPLGVQRFNLFTASTVGNGIILRGGSNDGISIQVNRVVAHTALVDQWTAQIRWIEL